MNTTVGKVSIGKASQMLMDDDCDVAVALSNDQNTFRDTLSAVSLENTKSGVVQGGNGLSNATTLIGFSLGFCG